jgi:group I intron endonuclease
MKGIIYKITNSINGKIYIGQTTRELESRWYNHTYSALVGKCATKLGRAIRKYGKDSFSIEIIEETDDLDNREIHFIAYYKSNSKGYNIKPGGNGGPHAKTTKRKISKANAKRIWTEEMRNNMSAAILAWHDKRGFVAKSQDFKNKISEANRGRKMSKKTKDIFQNHNRKSMKPVVCVTTNTEYESVSAACKDLDLNSGHMNMHLNNKCSHVKGFIFKLKT